MFPRGHSIRSGRGFALMTAVFILLVLAGLGTFLVATMTAQQRNFAADLLGTQAYQAARTGIEYGVYRTLKTGGLVAANDCTPAAVGSVSTQTTSFTLPGTLSGFSVTVACSGTSHVEAAPPNIGMYQITATACNRASCPASADGAYVERQIRVTVGSS